MTTNTINTAELRKLAESADKAELKGVWYAKEAFQRAWFNASQSEYMAAMRPSTMLALLDRLEKQEARIAELEAENDRMQRMIEGQMNLIAAMQDAASQVEAEPVMFWAVVNKAEKRILESCETEEEAMRLRGFAQQYAKSENEIVVMSLYAAQPPAPAGEKAVQEVLDDYTLAYKLHNHQFAELLYTKEEFEASDDYDFFLRMAKSVRVILADQAEVGKAVLSRCDAGAWPEEPTDAMQAAGAQAIRFDTTIINKIWTANAVYRAMRAAAIAAAQVKENDRE